MNIWIFNNYVNSPDLPGGTRHYDLGKELARRGHQVVIVTSSYHHYLHREIRAVPPRGWKLETIDGVKFVWLRTRPAYQRNDRHRVMNMMSFMLHAWRLGRKLPKLSMGIEKPDVIIGSSAHLLTPLAAYWVAEKYHARFIMEVRDLWPQTLIDMGQLSERNPITKVLQALEKYLYRRTEKIIALLPLAHEYITSCGIPRDKVIWIPNGVDLSRFDGVEAAASSSEGFRVMYLGAHGQANALDVLLRAAEIIQDQGHEDIRFILVGDGPEKPRLIKLAEDLKLGNLEFRDPVPKSDVPQALLEANGLIFNLERVIVFKYGISANKLFDYMASGRPALFSVEASNNPVDEARCGLTVPPRDPEALAEAIIKLYHMPKEEREAMGRRGREYVEKYHSIPVLADKLESCLKEVVGGSIKD